MRFAITDLLRNKKEIYNNITKPQTWNRVTSEFLVVGVVGLALFGLGMGTYVLSIPGAGSFPWWFMWKMIVVVVGPMVICTPALFVFSAIRGSTITLTQLVYLLCGAFATVGIVLLSLVPVTWFFTWTADTIHFIRTMNGLVLACALGFGMFFLGKGFIALHTEHKNEQSRAAADILLVWFVLFLVVVMQMSNKLGPWYMVQI